MKKEQLITKTIRFRKWSKKAYAIFASIGRNVTIGCLPKNVVDSSLAKQKSGISVSCKDYKEYIYDINKRKDQDIDFGIQLVLCQVDINPSKEKYIDITTYRNRNK